MEIIEKISSQIIDPLITFLFALAFLYFLWGVLGMFKEEKREEAKQHVIWGTIGLFVMVSVYGLIRVICKTIGAGC